MKTNESRKQNKEKEGSKLEGISWRKTSSIKEWKWFKKWRKKSMVERNQEERNVENKKQVRGGVVQWSNGAVAFWGSGAMG